VNAYANKSDPQLVAFIRQGDEQAFAELVHRHTDRFFALAFRTLGNQGDAEDVVQASFLKFWQRPHLWNPEKSKYTTWFYRVTINACHDLQRKSVRQQSLESSLVDQGLAAVDSEEVLIEEQQVEHWRQACVESGIRSLPTSQRDAINLVVYGEIAQKDAAEILAISIKALESLLHRAKKNLAKHVQQKLEEQTSTAKYLAQQDNAVSYHEN